MSAKGFFLVLLRKLFANRQSRCVPRNRVVWKETYNFFPTTANYSPLSTMVQRLPVRTEISWLAAISLRRFWNSFIFATALHMRRIILTPTSKLLWPTTQAHRICIHRWKGIAVFVKIPFTALVLNWGSGESRVFAVPTSPQLDQTKIQYSNRVAISFHNHVHHSHKYAIQPGHLSP